VGRPGPQYGRLVKRFARRHGLDVMIVVAAVAAVVEELSRSDDSAPVIAALAALLLVLPLLARRRSPFLAPVWLWLLAAALSFLDGRLVPSSAAVYAAGMLSAFLIGSLRDERQGRIGLAILAGGAAIVALHDPTRTLGEVLLVPATFSLAWLGGLAQRERAVQALRAEERASHAEREREGAARLAVAEERARIARELHDIVAHAVSVMVLQVGAVRHRLPDGFGEDVQALQGVEETGRSALGEMRRLLGAMRRSAPGFPSSCTSTARRRRCRRRSTSPPTASSRKASRMPSSTPTRTMPTSTSATPPTTCASRSATTATAPLAVTASATASSASVSA
jgi:signal transduction histidine kinase